MAPWTRLLSYSLLTSTTKNPFFFVEALSSRVSPQQGRGRGGTRRSNSNRPGPTRSSGRGGRGGRGRVNGVGNRSKHQTNHSNKRKNNYSHTNDDFIRLPSLTTPKTHPNALPYYFSCRHTYETALIEEIQRFIGSKNTTKSDVSSPSPGLVCVAPPKTVAADSGGSSSFSKLLEHLDPVYALQVMPKCHIVQAESINQLAKSAMTRLGLSNMNTDDDDDDDSGDDEFLVQQRQELRNAPRGSLKIHALVPGMFKGQKDPILKRRAYKIGEQLATNLKKGYPCARKRSNDENEDRQEEEKWVIQLILFSPEIMGVSLSKCHHPISNQLGIWPNWYSPAGLANVDIDDISMPSSAYRKLLEALNCRSQGRLPPQITKHNSDVAPVVDLGACPGGWTKALRLLGCKVIAVDRSELRDDLMDDSMVQFVTGDAFTYEPPMQRNEGNENTWMVSDVIAYPERVSEMLEQWCGNRWATNMIVTVKFQGNEIPWDALESAIEVATNHGYLCRAKHFFNNKNEVTLMLSYNDNDQIERNDDDTFSPILGKSMYPTVI